MNDLYLILIILAVVAFGYVLAGKLDRFFRSIQLPSTQKRQACRGEVRIAAEHHALSSAVTPVLKHCSAAYPDMTLSLSHAGAPRIIKKVLCEEADIGLLTDGAAVLSESRCACLRIPCKWQPDSPEAPQPSTGAAEQGPWIYVVWEKDRRSAVRDCVLAALENEHCRLTCGYADYRGQLPS